jgi:anti-sigma factor RsiW
MTAGDMTCQELVELVTDYFEDVLAPAQQARFEVHLETCAGCSAYLEQMRVTMQLVRSADALDARPDVAGPLRAFRDWHLTRD